MELKLNYLNSTLLDFSLFDFTVLHFTSLCSTLLHLTCEIVVVIIRFRSREEKIVLLATHKREVPAYIYFFLRRGIKKYFGTQRMPATYWHICTLSPSRE